MFQRISTVECELSELRHRARRLSETVNRLKEEALQEVALETTSVTPSIPEIVEDISPPSLPSEQKKPIAPTTPIAPIVEEAPITHEEVAGLEMELGRVWFVRIGILLLTTGFVFLSRYTYDNFIRDLGPGIRLIMMYFFSFTLTGVGLFCEKWKESLKSYGRIVAAGGLAAIYYCGFAAHNIETLRVIESPVLASLVLTISAGLFCALSLCRESRVMLSTSLGLAFYSISVNPIGWMACLSAIILATFGVIMMVRYRWVEIGFVVLIGSYLSHTWWQFAISQGDNPIARWFLPAYWVLFASASLLASHEMDEERHLIFTSVNNGAFFFLFSFHLESGQWMERHWLFCFILGAALLSIGLFTKVRLPDQSRLLHLAKGTGLITLGLALLLNGHQLFIALLIEAIVLMALNLRKQNLLLTTTAWVVGLLSCVALGDSSPTTIPWSAYLFGTFGWLSLGAIHRFAEHNDRSTLAHPGGTVAALISVIFLIFGVMQHWTHLDRALTFAVIGSLVAGIGLFRKPRTYAFDALVIYHLVGLIALGSIFLATDPGRPALLASAALALGTSIPNFLHWKRANDSEERMALHLISGVSLAMAIGFIWLLISQSRLPDAVKISLVLLIPLGGTATARFTGMLAHSIIPFSMHLALVFLNLESGTTLAIGLLITLAHFDFIRRFHRLADREILLSLLLLIGAGFWGLWLVEVLVHPALPLVITGVALLLAAEVRKPRPMSLTSIPFLGLGLILALVSGMTGELYLCLLAPLFLHLARTVADSAEKFHALAVICLLLLWFQITKDAPPLPLAAVWAVTGTILLLIGLGFKSRCFRLIGLIILASSLGHLMLIDLIKLDPLPRILSFMTLGIGLLGLGYVYNRYQDRLKLVL